MTSSQSKNHSQSGSPHAQSSRIPRIVWATGSVSLLTDLATELVYALLPIFYTTTLSLSQGAMGLVEGTAESVASLTKLFSGHLSDRTGGRKWWMVVGYSLSGITKSLLPWAGGTSGVFALRSVDRFGKGIRSTPRDAIIAREVPAELRGKAFGFQRAMDHAGAMLGSLIAAGLLYFGLVRLDHLKMLFLATLIPSTLAVLIILVFIWESPESRNQSDLPEKQPFSLIKAYRDQSAPMKRYLVVLGIFTLGNSTDALLLLRAKGQLASGGVSDTTAVACLPLLWAWLHVVKSASSTQGGSLSDRIGRKTLVRWGWLVYSAVYAGFALWNSAMAPWVLFGIYGLYFGLVEGPELALIADLSNNSAHRGSAYGLYHFIAGILALPASLLCGVLWTFGGPVYGPVVAFLTGSAMALIAAALLPWALSSVPKPATPAN